MPRVPLPTPQWGGAHAEPEGNDPWHRTTLLVLGAFPVLGAGLVPLAAPAFYDGFPAWARTVLGSGISAGAPVAVLLNLFFPHLGTRSTPRAAVLSAASPGSGTQIP